MNSSCQTKVLLSKISLADLKLDWTKTNTIFITVEVQYNYKLSACRFLGMIIIETTLPGSIIKITLIVNFCIIGSLTKDGWTDVLFWPHNECQTNVLCHFIAPLLWQINHLSACCFV